MSYKIPGFSVILLVFTAFIAADCVVFSYHPLSGIFYSVFFVFTFLNLLFFFCRKCPHVVSKDCRHVIVGPIVSRLYKIIPPSKYMSAELFFAFTPIAICIVFPQYWLFKMPVVLAAFWLLLLICALIVNFHLCPVCRNCYCLFAKKTKCNPLIELLAAFIMFSNFSHSVYAADGGWKFSWSDEFNGTSIDNTVWGYENGYVRNNELQYYTNRTENACIDSGNLLITALRENYSGYKYTSASMRTMGKKSWQYGRFEIRAKIDIRKGSWPAWWWLPNSGGWPKGGEIDMMEYYNSKCLFNVMDGSQKWASVTKAVSTLGGEAWANQFHVWTMEWDSTKIDLLLDGVLMNHYVVNNANGTGPSGANPFRKPGYILINQAIGGNNGGDPSGTTFPVEYRVDWVRVHVWSSEDSKKLTVKNGTGSGPYVAGTKASITAIMPSYGNVFDKWVIESGEGVIDDSASPGAFITMKNSDVTVTAKFRSTSVLIPAGKKCTTGRQMFTNSVPAIFDINGRKLSSSDGYQLPTAGGIYIRLSGNSIPQKLLIQK